MKTFKIIEHRIIAEDLTKEEADKLVIEEESHSDLNEVWFEIQAEESLEDD